MLAAIFATLYVGGNALSVLFADLWAATASPVLAGSSPVSAPVSAQVTARATSNTLHLHVVSANDSATYGITKGAAITSFEVAPAFTGGLAVTLPSMLLFYSIIGLAEGTITTVLVTSIQRFNPAVLSGLSLLKVGTKA